MTDAIKQNQDAGDIERKHLGGRNELLACVWLLNQGYEVFRNVSQHGETDLIATKDGHVYFFDVKKGARNVAGERARGKTISASAALRGIKPLYVYDDGTCEIEWEPRTPLLLESNRNCARCGTSFKPNHQRQQFCTSHCRTYSHLGR
jgi:hypothetical protein